jgi:hypothetical protein
MTATTPRRTLPKFTDRLALGDRLFVAPATPDEVAALAEALEKGPLDDEDQAHLIKLAAVAAGRTQVVPDPNDSLPVEVAR